MIDVNAEKGRQLGMPFGTASNKLRKLVLFSFLQKYNEDICYRCNQKIETVEELSLEHKQPWFNNSVKLFWDLNNISFSHLHCNSSFINRDKSIAKRKIGPKGTVWCSTHQEFLPINQFSPEKRRWSGFFWECKSCHAKKKQERSKKKRAAVA